MRKILKAFLRLAMIGAALKLIAVFVARAYEGDDTASPDDFKLMALMDGRQLKSEATSLRTGSATAAIGGIEIELRDAVPDPGGAHIVLKAYMGGIRMVVPATWKVYVNADSRMGGIETDVPDPEELDDDAPRVTVEAVACCGGILIETAD